MPFSFWLGLVAVAAVGVVGLIGARGLGAGATPEQLATFRARLSAWAGAVGVALWVVGELRLIPPLVLVALATWFPVRRRIFAETWGFAGYLAQLVRLAIGLYTTWLLVVLGPGWLSRLDGPALWQAAIGLAGLIFVTEAVLRVGLAVRVWGARRGTAALEERLAALAAHVGLPVPRLLVAPDRGGRSTLIGIFPARPRSTLIVDQTLVDALAADELTALLARELAHDEAARRRSSAGAVLAVGLLAASTAALAVLASYQAWLVQVTPLLLFVYLVHAMRGMPDDVERDRRAVEMTGDPDALCRALVRLAELRHEPRREDPGVDGARPGLAQRLQRIREVGAGAYRQMATPMRLERPEKLAVAGGGGTWVVLEPTRAAWLSGVPAGTPTDPAALLAAAPAARIVAYADLRGLAVVGLGSGHGLRARRDGEPAWTVPLAAADVPVVQTYLDGVETQVARTQLPAALGLAAVATGLGGLVAAMSGLAGGFFVLPAVTVLAAPGPLAFAGLAAVSGVWMLENALTGGSPLSTLVLAVVGGAALLLLRRWPAGEERAVRRRRWALGSYAVAAGLALLPIVVVHEADNPIVNRFLHGVPAILVAAGLVFVHAFGLRRGAFAAVLPVAGFMVLGYQVAELPPEPTLDLAVVPDVVAVKELRRFPLAAPVDELRVAADGSAVAVRDDGSWRLLGESPAVLGEAEDVVLLPGDHAVAVVHDVDGRWLVRFAAGVADSRLPLPRAGSARLLAYGHHAFAVWIQDAEEALVLSGTLTAGALDEARFATGPDATLCSSNGEGVWLVRGAHPRLVSGGRSVTFGAPYLDVRCLPPGDDTGPALVVADVANHDAVAVWQPAGRSLGERGLQRASSMWHTARLGDRLLVIDDPPLLGGARLALPIALERTDPLATAGDVLAVARAGEVIVYRVGE